MSSRGQVDFRHVFEQAREAQLLLNLDGRVVSVSEGYLRVTTGGRAEVLGRLMAELPPYSDGRASAQRMQQALSAVQRSKLSDSWTFEDERAAGASEAWSRATLRAISDESGAVCYVVHLLEQAAAGLADRSETHSERRLRKLIELSYDCVALVDAQGRTTYVSPSIERLTGYSAQEFAALSPLALVHPDDVSLVAQEITRLLANPGGTMTVQIRNRHRDGGLRHFEVSGINRLHDPDVAALVSTFHDVTRHVELERDLRAAGDRLRVALGAAHALSWDRDLLAGYDEYSSDFREFFGMPADGPQLFELDATVHADDRQAVTAATARCQATGEDLNIEFRGPDKHGKPRWYAAHGQVLRAPDGQALRMIGVTWDVTERKRMLDERLLLDQRMQESQKLESLGVLAGGVAHDFNNILMAILGNANLTRLAVGPNPPALTHLTQIEEAARRAADLCRQMLAYAGKGRFVLTRANINALIEETMYLLQVSISKKAVLRFHLDARLPAVVVDVTQLRQVLMNLAINASDAIGELSGVISISTGVVRADRPYLAKTFLAPEVPAGDYVYLEVSDTGVGMSPETQTRMFEPFFTTKFTGRGLGLAAVLGIVRGHQGALKVYSEVGKGSSFKLLLPAAYEESDLLAPLPATTPHLAAQGTILVIDDEETVRAVTCHMLEVLGFGARTAADGREALAVYREHGSEIACVLVDLTMPHLDGEETFRELRRLNPDVRVLLMSGYNEQDAIARFVGKGLAGFVQKPFNLDELRDKLIAVLA